MDRTLPRRCLAAAIGETLAPSSTFAASPRKAEGRVEGYAAIAVVGSYTAQDRDVVSNPNERALVEGLKDTVRRTNASTADRMVISVIALTVG